MGDSQPMQVIEMEGAAPGHILRFVREILSPEGRLFAVVKANGYGHCLSATLEHKGSGLQLKPLFT